MFLHFPFPFFNLIWVRSSLHKFILQCCIPLLLYASTHHLILLYILLYDYSVIVYGSYTVLWFTPLCLYAFMHVRLYACTPLRLYASKPLRISAYTPLRIYASTALRLHALKPLRLYASISPRLYACKIVVLYSAVSYWGGYNRHKRDAESSLESRVECSFSRHPV